MKRLICKTSLLLAVFAPFLLVGLLLHYSALPLWLSVPFLAIETYVLIQANKAFDRRWPKPKDGWA